MVGYLVRGRTALMFWTFLLWEREAKSKNLHGHKKTHCEPSRAAFRFKFWRRSMDQFEKQEVHLTPQNVKDIL